MTVKHTLPANSPNDKDVLSLQATGRVIDLDAVSDEFGLMKILLKNPLTAEVAIQVCQKSGTHLLKIISPRADSNQCCLYFREPDSSVRPEIFPSVPAGDIPFSKVLFHPFEISDRPPRSVVDDIMNPDETSDFILDAFANVFGKDVLEAVREALLNKVNVITELPSRDFPIVFAPRENGDDLQLTPISPAFAFRGVQNAINTLYERKKASREQVPGRACIERQLISLHPQNISPMINRTRHRLMARLPVISNPVMEDIRNFAITGVFPRWRDRDIANLVLQYAEFLGPNVLSDNAETQLALDQMADRLIQLALDFVQETKAEIRLIAGPGDRKFVDPVAPGPVKVLLDCQYETDIYKARVALTGPHFTDRLAVFIETGRTAA